MNFQTKFVVAVTVLLVSAFIISIRSASCPKCRTRKQCKLTIRAVKQKCKRQNRPVINQLATCGCCRVCGQKLGEYCGGPAYVYGQCGANLTCSEKYPENGNNGTCLNI
ncbi:Uncharacterised protein g4742 [Pycnogonum litorale]